MKGKLLVFGLSLLAAATVGVVQLQSKAVDNSRDCDRFAIIRCGTLTRSELVKEYETNNTAGANGSTAAQGDIKKVFTAMGISRSDLNLNVKQGVVYKDGTVKVDGKVVATNAMTAARGIGGSQIAGTNAQRVSVSAMGDAQSAMVFYQDGKFKFAVMKPCGNPVSATPKEEPKPEPQPEAKCVGVTATMQERNKYLVEATAQTKDGAKIKSYNFKVTSGSKTIFDKDYPTSNKKQSVVYQGLQPGEYKVKVTVKTSEGVKGGQDCVATFTVAPEPTQPTPGVTITKFVDNDKKYLRVNEDVEFSYRIDVTNTGNTDLNNVLITDTPDRAITLLSVTPPSGSIDNNTFTYTIPTLLKGETRTFTLTAKVPAAQAGRLVNTVCVDAPSVPGNPDKCDSAEVEVPPTPVPGKIEVCLVEEDRIIEINEDEYDRTIHSKNLADCDQPEEDTPAELPKTGPVESMLSVFGAMNLAGASAYYLASRRSL